MIEAHLEGTIDRHRPAEADTSKHRELVPTFQQQSNDLQEVLIPSHSDPVLGDSPEPRHDSCVEAVINVADIS